MRRMLAAIIGLAAALTACPPRPIPPPPPGTRCVDFQSLTPFPQNFTGPTFSFTPLDFVNPTDPNGTPLLVQLTDRTEDLDGRPELYVAFSRDGAGYRPLFVDFPASGFPSGVPRATVELRHFNSAQILARNAAGAVISQASQPTQNTRVTLSLAGPGIRRLQFNTIETLVYRICWAY